MSIAKELFEDSIGMHMPAVLYLDYGKGFSKGDWSFAATVTGRGPAGGILPFSGQLARPISAFSILNLAPQQQVQE